MLKYLMCALSLAMLLLVSCSNQAVAPNAKTDPAKSAAPAAHDHGHDHDHHDAPKIDAAVCVLVPVAQSGVSGTIHFKPEDGKLHVTGTVSGLTPGKHGFHVHEFGDVSDTEEGLSVGGHFNPEGHEHGARDAKERHAGDFGNIEADAGGEAKIDFVDSVAEFVGPTSIIGRGIVVHVGEDTFVQPTGDAGGRLAIGVIGVAKQ